LRNIIPIEVKKKCVEMSRRGKTYKEIYKQYYSKLYDTKYTGFRSMIKRWKKKSYADTEILETGNLDYRFTPHGTTVQIDRNGEIVQSWIKSKTEDRLFLELIENIEQLPKIKPVDIDIKQVEDYMLEIPLFDMHWGIADYNYYKDTLRQTLDIISRRTYKEIYIIVGQDLFHNDDFRGRTSKGTQVHHTDICKAWNDARQFYYTMIDKALKHSSKMTVMYSKGNHDESMSWAFVQMIKAQYNNITIDDDTRDRKVITFGSNFIGVTHGDKTRARSNRLPSMFTIEYPIEFANSKVREIHCGHLHHENQKDDYGIMLRRLSTGNQTDDWHSEHGFVGAHKRFTIFEWSTKKLASIHYV